MEQLFKYKTAVVTGASSGIGRSTAIAFAREGAKVAAIDIDEQGGALTTKAIEDEGLEAAFYKCDTSDPDEVRRVFGDIREKYGQVHAAFNNAGIEGVKAPTAQSDNDNFEKLLNVNLQGIYYCLKQELSIMEAAKHGAIVNCSSVAGLVGFPNLPHYTATKHGVIGLTKNAAIEYAKLNIRVNAVCPGPIETPMINRIIEDNEAFKQSVLASIPMGRFGKPAEVAEAVIWLCSHKASLITGQAISADGGYVAQ